WPYDEGGCGCKDCRPWGANKYCDGCIGVREETLKLYPNAKFIVSTWTFDMPDDEGEYEGLYKRLKGDMSWVDYLMVDAHGDFPHYPLEHELIKPVVNFPEISMWALSPWGGFGASPLPERFQKLWDSSKRILSGGMPYSEGIYEDISKIQCVSYYWEPDRNYRDILAEYISYEYSNEVVDDVIEMIACIEKNHTAVSDGKKPDLNLALHGKTLADSVNECLCERAKKAWRWRILYIRGILDYKRYSRYIENDNRESETLDKLIKFSGEYLIEDRKAQELFKELQGYYHCVPYNGENAWTLPPLGGFYWLKKS
ncbi:MAG: hypothetical protein Q8882_09290, partial [Bacillota bacterium]|nr:hypothetical protein [Bacillota bacterium]